MADTALVCWKCGASLKHVPRPITRRSNCPECYAELHCCVMCKRYDTRYPNRCSDERADPPVHKDSANFCEYFAPKPDAFDEGGGRSARKAEAELKSLFGESDGENDGTPAEPETGDDRPETEEEKAKRELEKLFKT